MIQAFFSRFFSSFSTASRMNSARLFGPATASIRSGMPSGSLTTVAFTPMSGRPLVSTFFNFISLKAISLIDTIPDIAYKRNIRSRETDMQQIIQNGTKAVSIYGNTEVGPFTARLYVNCEVGQLGDATLVSTKRKSLACAIKWANTELAR